MNTPEHHGEGPPVTLSDGVVLLRPWFSSDASFMAEAATDPAIQRYNSPAPSSVADALSNIEGIAQRWRSFEVDGDPTGVAFAVTDAASGEPVGMCGIDHWSGTDVAQFGYWLAAVARGRGLATRSVRLMTSWLFERGAARVFVTIESDNAASAAVARRAGFTTRERFAPTVSGKANARTSTSLPCFPMSGRRRTTADCHQPLVRRTLRSAPSPSVSAHASGAPGRYQSDPPG